MKDEPNVFCLFLICGQTIPAFISLQAFDVYLMVKTESQVMPQS